MRIFFKLLSLFSVILALVAWCLGDRLIAIYAIGLACYNQLLAMED